MTIENYDIVNSIIILVKIIFEFLCNIYYYTLYYLYKIYINYIIL